MVLTKRVDDKHQLPSIELIVGHTLYSDYIEDEQDQEVCVFQGSSDLGYFQPIIRGPFPVLGHLPVMVENGCSMGVVHLDRSTLVVLQDQRSGWPQHEFDITHVGDQCMSVQCGVDNPP
jgi:hypothetical protein